MGIQGIAMDLRELAKKTNCSFRRLRYLVEHRIVPEPTVSFHGRGSVRPRVFSEATGVLIACGAILLDAGIKREIVQRVIEVLPMIAVKTVSRKQIALWEDLMADDVKVITVIADGRLIRLDTDYSIDKTGWIDLTSLKQVKLAETPIVTLHIDIGQVRDQIVSTN